MPVFSWMSVETAAYEDVTGEIDTVSNGGERTGIQQILFLFDLFEHWCFPEKHISAQSLGYVILENNDKNSIHY